VVLLLWVILCVSPTVTFGQHAQRPKRVLVLYWYDREFGATGRWEQSFQTALEAGSSSGIEYYPEYLQSNKFPGEQQSRALHDYLLQKYADRPIDVVVAQSEASLDFLLQYRNDLFPQVPIVFYTPNSPNPNQLATNADLTGVIVFGKYREAIDLPLDLHPTTEQVFVVSGTLQHDQQFEKAAREELKGYEGKVQINFLTDLAPDELVARTKSLPERSIVLYVWQQALDKNGRVLETAEILDSIVRTTPVPIYGMSGPAVGRGVIGGYVYTQEDGATKVAEVVRRIINGEQPRNIPIVDAPKVFMFDWRELQRWKISENSLPPGSIVKFREFTFWQLYKWRIIGVLALIALQALLIAFLLIERRRLRIATEARRHLAAIVESSDDAILSQSLDGRILSWNSGAELMYGYSADEMIGQTVSKLALADNNGEASEIIDRIGAGESDHLEAKSVRKDGRQIDVSLRISALKDEHGKIMGASTIARDITERKQAEEALRQSETRFRNMADNSPVMIWISGTDKLCTYVNKQFLDFTGRTMEQELGEGWAEGVHADDYDYCLDTYTTSFDNRKRFEMEYRLRRADGEYRWVLASGTPRFSSDGEFLGYIGSCIDISQRKESEEALHKAHAELKELKNQLEAENIYLQSELQLDRSSDAIVGQSDAIKYVLFKVNQVAPTDSTVLIMGETGTGKELVARAIHEASLRKHRSLIKVNCAALSAGLIESELFGHEKGAFTGAATRKLGRFELANGGTIFLDEIGELPPELQVKLLRVLQEGELERVGGTKTIKVDVRIIAATNRDLKAEVEKGTFRQDLWYRLNVFPITVPPLKQRREDIPLLVEHFVEKSARNFGKKIDSVSTKTMQSLHAHSWPGNVRELANVIERAVITTQGSVLRLADRFEQPPDQAETSSESLEEMERQYIISVLESTGWRISGPYGAAKILGLNPSTLRTKMTKFQIQRQRGISA
jgi:PAS domain S-box-containing protein